MKTSASMPISTRFWAVALLAATLFLGWALFWPAVDLKSSETTHAALPVYTLHDAMPAAAPNAADPALARPLYFNDRRPRISVVAQGVGDIRPVSRQLFDGLGQPVGDLGWRVRNPDTETFGTGNRETPFETNAEQFLFHGNQASQVHETFEGAFQPPQQFGRTSVNRGKTAGMGGLFPDFFNDFRHKRSQTGSLGHLTRFDHADDFFNQSNVRITVGIGFDLDIHGHGGWLENIQNLRKARDGFVDRAF